VVTFFIHTDFGYGLNNNLGYSFQQSALVRLFTFYNCPMVCKYIILCIYYHETGVQLNVYYNSGPSLWDTSKSRVARGWHTVSMKSKAAKSNKYIGIGNEERRLNAHFRAENIFGLVFHRKQIYQSDTRYIYILWHLYIVNTFDPLLQSNHIHIHTHTRADGYLPLCIYYRARYNNTYPVVVYVEIIIVIRRGIMVY